MKWFKYLALSCLCFLPVAAGAQEEMMKQGDQLTLQRCVDIGLRQHPTVIAARNNVIASQSRVYAARSNYYPQIATSSSYSRIKPMTGVQRAADTGIPGTTPSTATSSYDSYTSSLTLSQNIYDFGRTGSQVDIQKFNLDASRQDLDTTINQVVFEVKQAYFGVLQSQRNRVVAEETVVQFQKHLEQARGFFEVGTKPKFDVTKAEVDLSNAKLSLIKAENAVKVSKVVLDNAMGVPEAPAYTVEDNLAFQKFGMPFQEALEAAYKNRPDLQSLVSRRMSIERSIDLARADFYPVLTGNAAYNRGGSSFFRNEGWNVGVALAFPIFSGFLTKNQVEEARANLAAAKANEETLKQSIYLDIQQAYLNLGVAEDSIANTLLTVQQATENFEIANGRYAAGVGNPIEVTDAEVSLTNAKTSHIQALYDYKVAQANLERAMGRR